MATLNSLGSDRRPWSLVMLVFRGVVRRGGLLPEASPAIQDSPPIDHRDWI